MIPLARLAPAFVAGPLFLLLTPLATHAQAEGREPRNRNVAILIFPGVELLDFAGPGEAFAAAHTTDGSRFTVYTVAESREPVTSMGFCTITPGYTLDDCPPPDIVVAPGGDVPTQSERVRAWLQTRAESAQLMMSVCNGAALFARAGLLAGREVTSHHSALRSVALIEPTARVYSNRRFVDSGDVLTTAGVSAGIDGSLHAIARLIDDESARRTARYMEYDWRPDEIAALHAQPGIVVGARATWLLASLAEHGQDATLATYRRKAADAGDEFEREYGQAALNREGYTLLMSERLDDAVRLFRFVVAAYPSSANGYDSLSEALEVAGQREAALAYARQALQRLESDEALSDGRRARIRQHSSQRIERLTSGRATVWVCQPCNRACDDARFDEPGTCPDPGCAMALVPLDEE